MASNLSSLIVVLKEKKIDASKCVYGYYKEIKKIKNKKRRECNFVDKNVNAI